MTLSYCVVHLSTSENTNNKFQKQPSDQTRYYLLGHLPKLVQVRSQDSLMFPCLSAQHAQKSGHIEPPSGQNRSQNQRYCGLAHSLAGRMGMMRQGQNWVPGQAHQGHCHVIILGNYSKG